MLLTRSSYLIATFFLVVELAIPASAKISNLEEKLSIIDSLVSHAREQFNISAIAVGIVADGKTIFQKGYGLRDPEDIRGSPVTARTLFGIGSCSKPFITYALDRLVMEDGALAWNDLVLSHIPEFRLKDIFMMDRIQIRDLVTHVSGIPANEYVAHRVELSQKQLFRRIAQLCNNYDLREKFQYNNLVFSMAGVVLERVTGELWEDAVRSLVFQPLNLTLTFPTIDAAADYRKDQIIANQSDVIEIVRPPRISKNGSVKHTLRPYVRNMAPSGSVYSCVEDMVKWIHAQLALSGSAKGLHDAQVVVPPGSFVDGLDGGETFAYGLGRMLSRHRGRRLVWCGGPFDEFISRLILCPEKNLGVVVLMNPDKRSLGRVVHNLVLQIVDTLTKDGPAAETSDPVEWVKQQANTFLRVPDAGESDSKLNCSDCFKKKIGVVDDLFEYQGVFEHAAYGTIKFKVKKGQLTATRDTQDFVLKPGIAADFFRAHSDDGFTFPCSFMRNPVGDVTHFFIELEPACRPISFVKSLNEQFYLPWYLEPFRGVYENNASYIQLKPVKMMSPEGMRWKLWLRVYGNTKYAGLLTPRRDYFLAFWLRDEAQFNFVYDLPSSRVIELHVTDEDSGETVSFNRTM